MKRATYKDITKWFSLDNYEYILDLNVRNVIWEARMREYLSSEQIDLIEKAEFPLIKDFNSLEYEPLGYSILSCDDRGMLPLNFAIICEFVNSCLSDGRIVTVDNGFIEPREDIKNDDIFNQTIFYDRDDPTSEGKTGIYLDMGFDLMDDEEAIASFSSLLAKWRVEANMPVPVLGKKIKFGPSTISKIYSYSTLAYLDIAAWANKNELVVSNELYARLLYPSHKGVIKGGAHIKDTVKPFATSMGEIFSWHITKTFFNKNSYLSSMRFLDFLKISEI
ncbi:TPA: DUF6387 family protein [Yersinia enterocolitica]